MGHKIFASYKYADNDVFNIGNPQEPTTVRDYVTLFEKQLGRSSSIYKGEHEDEDMSHCSDEVIKEKLKAQIYDSSITVLFISRNMKNPNISEDKQWIAWEMEYSLRKKTRNGKPSYANAVVGVILPDRHGDYWYYQWLIGFNIVSANISNGYITVVKWEDFISNTTKYFDKALKTREGMSPSIYPKYIF